MAVWTDKALITTFSSTSTITTIIISFLSHPLSIFPGGEWMDPSRNRSVRPVRGRSANEVTFLPGAQFCSCQVLSQACPTKRGDDASAGGQRHNSHACASTTQASVSGQVWPCLNVSSSTAGGGAAGPALFIRHPSPCQLWVMRADSQGDHTTTLPASRSAWWPCVWAKKDQRQACKRGKKKEKAEPTGKEIDNGVKSVSAAFLWSLLLNGWLWIWHQDLVQTDANVFSSTSSTLNNQRK